MTSTNINRGDTFEEVRKRDPLFDNEVIKEEAAEQVHCIHYGDRYIPRRRAITRSTATTDNETRPTRTTSACAELLKSALNLHSDRALQFTDPSIPRPFFTNGTLDFMSDHNFYYQHPQIVFTNPKRFKNLDWLCKPRQMPTIDPNSSHEFEGFTGTAVGTRIVWAVTGNIISYCENSLLLWNPNEDVITKYDFQGKIITMAHHPHYRYLATSNQHKGRDSINVWSMSTKTMLNCFCYTPVVRALITALCWSKSGIQLLSGNAQGIVCTLNFYGQKQLIHSTRPFIHAMIKDIKCSASGRYVASLDILGKLCVWSYNSGNLILHHIWDMQPSTWHSMDWHPWSDADLALCIQRGQQILLLNMNSKRIEAHSVGHTFKFERPVISFNKVSAELVVSCQQKAGAGGSMQRNVLVLGAIDRVVDEILDVGNIETPFMWSANNEQLAFVAGNDIQIFNFFGASHGTSSRPRRLVMPRNSENLGANNSIFEEFDYIK